jgi:lipoprotein NlpD
MPRSRSFLINILLLSVLTGCTGGGILSPDVDYNSPYARSPDFRTVLRGDTLFSIAWDVGVDFRTLAQWNNIPAPYVIRPGQHLRVKAPAKGPGRSASIDAKSDSPIPGKYYRVKKGDTVYGVARKSGRSPNEIIVWNGLRKPFTIRPGQRLRVSPAGTIVSNGPRSRPKKARASTRQRSGRPQKVGKWVWPASGKILRRFSPNGANKGIDISGRAGQTVRAAAGGTVVYQGSGLRGYGQLIIIKHNPDYLSAYAHCSRIFVTEGTRVKRGQKIATMGSTGTNRVKLHFEIRLRGNPVNPTRYLPRKS